MRVPGTEYNFTPNMRGVAIATLLAVGATGLAACGGSGKKEDARSAHDLATKCLKSGLDGRSTEADLPVPGEKFKLHATYTTDYDIKSWKITDSKALGIELELVPEEKGAKTPQVLIENMHADATIKSRKRETNGLPADSMDDHLHVGMQSGFEITPEHPYRERFLISGFSQTLTSAWGTFVNGYGSFTEEEQRLTEKNLIKQGAYGEEIAMVTDVLVRDPATQEYYKTIVADSLIVPLAGKSC